MIVKFFLLVGCPIIKARSSSPKQSCQTQYTWQLLLPHPIRREYHIQAQRCLEIYTSCLSLIAGRPRLECHPVPMEHSLLHSLSISDLLNGYCRCDRVSPQATA